MGTKLIAGIGAAAAGLYLLNHLGTRRGASPDEARRTLPGDSLLPEAGVETTHAITIHAPSEAIWPWLVQVGYQRAGWYTDSWIDDFSYEYFFKNIAQKEKKPDRWPSADQIMPQFQDLQIGDEVPDGPPGTVYYTVKMMEPNRHMVLYSDSYDNVIIPEFVRGERQEPMIENTWAFVFDEIGPETTRFIVRARIQMKSLPIGLVYWPFLMLGEAVFPQLMLNGFKKRAEQSISPASDQVSPRS
jgi:hypothetical protein